MPGELIPPPELGHTLPEGLSHAQLVDLYLDALETNEQMLIAGLQATLPAGADIREAVKRCYDRQSDEHFESLVRMAERFQQIEAIHGRNRSD
jgi:hypothetical protein